MAIKWFVNNTVPPSSHTNFICQDTICLYTRLALCTIGMATNIAVSSFQYRNRMFGILPLRIGFAMMNLGLLYTASLFILTFLDFSLKNELIATISLVFRAFVLVIVTNVLLDRLFSTSKKYMLHRRDRRRMADNFAVGFTAAMLGTVVYGYGTSNIHVTGYEYLALTVILPLTMYAVLGLLNVAAVRSNRNLGRILRKSLRNVEWYTETKILWQQTRIILLGYSGVSLLLIICSLPLLILRIITHTNPVYIHLLQSNSLIPSHMFHLQLLPFILDPVVFGGGILRRFSTRNAKIDKNENTNETPVEVDYASSDDMGNERPRLNQFETETEQGIENPAFNLYHVMETRL